VRNILAELWLSLSHPYKSGFNDEELSPEKRKLFLDKCAKKNRFPALVIMFMVLVMESFMVFCYLIQPYVIEQASFFPQYIYLYLSMIIVSSVSLILLHVYKDLVSKLIKLEYFILIALGIWSAVFSACDVINGFSSYLFIQIMIINSLIIRVRAGKHCAINIICYLLYMLIILNYDLSITITFAELVNPFLMMVASCVIIILNNRINYRSYINQELIKEQNKKLEYYANNDFLTNIPNRKSIIDYLNNVLQTEKNISCMMIDIDDFKLYNDTFGHLVGDDCLISIAKDIENYVLEKGGKVGRFGGEEFLAIFINQKDECVIKIANQLVDKIREKNIDFPANIEYQVLTISIGVHFVKEIMNVDAHSIISFADDALYKAKNEGKNKISLYRH